METGTYKTRLVAIDIDDAVATARAVRKMALYRFLYGVEEPGEREESEGEEIITHHYEDAADFYGADLTQSILASVNLPSHPATQYCNHGGAQKYRRWKTQRASGRK